MRVRRCVTTDSGVRRRQCLSVGLRTGPITAPLQSDSPLLHSSPLVRRGRGPEPQRLQSGSRVRPSVDLAARFDVCRCGARTQECRPRVARQKCHVSAHLQSESDAVKRNFVNRCSDHNYVLRFTSNEKRPTDRPSLNQEYSAAFLIICFSYVVSYVNKVGSGTHHLQTSH